VGNRIPVGKVAVAVNQHGGEATRLGAAINPVMLGALLPMNSDGAESRRQTSREPCPGRRDVALAARSSIVS